MDFLATLLVAAFALLIGLGFSFWGYRLFLVFLPVLGFFAGFWIGAQTFTLIFGEGFLATGTSWIVGFVVGLVVALLSYLFYLVGVAILAGTIGAALAGGLLSALGLESGLLVFIVSLAAAILVAVLALRYNLQKYVIILLTAVVGANAIILSVLLVLGRVSLDSLQRAGTAITPVLQDSWFWLVAWVIIAAAGIFFQLRHNRTYEFWKEDYVQGWG
jgi:hypothetical protein